MDAAGNKVGGAVGGAVSAGRDAVGDTARGATDTVSRAAGKTQEAARSAASNAHTETKSGGGFWKWLIPLLIAVAAWFGFKKMNDTDVDVEGAASGAMETAKEAGADASAAAGDVMEKAKEAGADASAAAGDAMEKITGADFGGKLTGVFGSASETLGGITDVDSAKAALPKLEEMGGSLDGLTGMLSGADDATKSAAAAAAGKGMETLTPVIDKLKGDGGIWEVIGPVTEPILEKLKAFM